MVLKWLYTRTPPDRRIRTWRQRGTRKDREGLPGIAREMSLFNHMEAQLWAKHVPEQVMAQARGAGGLAVLRCHCVRGVKPRQQERKHLRGVTHVSCGNTRRAEHACILSTRKLRAAKLREPRHMTNRACITNGSMSGDIITAQPWIPEPCASPVEEIHAQFMKTFGLPSRYSPCDTCMSARRRSSG